MYIVHVCTSFVLLISSMLYFPLYTLYFRIQVHCTTLFQPQDLLQEDLKHFFLVGMICGLAIYNGVNLDLAFPLVVYKKLLGGTGLQ